MKYRRDIDGLRAFAVALVIAFHAGFTAISGGFIGVDIFFVISGYLITSIIWTQLSQGKFSFGYFYIRRIRRILPALFFIVASTLPLSWLLLLPHELESFLKSVIATLFFVSNIFFWNEVGYFDITADLKPLLHTWSLSVEEQFYLIYPLIISLAWGLSKKTAIIFLIVAAIFSFLSSLITFTSPQFLHRITEPSASFFLLTGRLWELLLGGGLAIFMIENKSKLLLMKQSVKEVFGLLGILVIILASFFYLKDASFTWAHILLGALGASLIIIFCDQNTLVGRFLSGKVLSGLGLLSYSAYLWHQPIFALYRVYSIETPSTNVMLFLCFLIIPISYLSWRFIEIPFRNDSIGNSRFFKTISIVGLIIISVSFSLLYRNDTDRYASSELEVVGDFALRNAYVWEKKNQLNLSSFIDGHSAEKVLIIGDSYSGDLINAVIEVNNSNNLSISSAAISPTCLSVFVSYLSTDIDVKNYLDCGDWIRDRKLLLLLEEANFVIIAGNWQMENLNSLVKVYKALNKKFGRKTTIVGVKGFSKNTRVLQSIPQNERAAYKISPKEGLAEINRLIKAEINEDFFDLINILCPAKKCPAFTANLQIISYDQGHLTKAGAHEVGNAIKRHYPFKAFMN
jgi:peptidoglycan/LPS O-acetylase OafA/YrhL